MKLKTLKNLAVRLTAAGAVLAGMATVAPAPAYAASSWHGCPVGAACLFAGSNPSNPGGIIYTWWDGTYRLSNIFGNHVLANNQTDGWQVDLCTDWNGFICPMRLGSIPGYTITVENFTPINSVRLHEYV